MPPFLIIVLTEYMKKGKLILMKIQFNKKD